jgi:hypothetical protein
MLKHNNDYSEQNTINFSRKDLLNTLSEDTFANIIHKGGNKKDRVKEIPTRNRYKEYEGFKATKKQAGGNNDVYSTVSEREMNVLRDMITFRQNGGACSCGENRVLEGGCGCGQTSVFVPAKTHKRTQKGGVDSATSPMMPGMTDIQPSATSPDMPANVEVDSATSTMMPGMTDVQPSATSPDMPANVEVDSATSTMMPGMTDVQPSATSPMPANVEVDSATSTMMPGMTNVQPSTTSPDMQAESVSSNMTVVQAEVSENTKQTQNKVFKALKHLNLDGENNEGILDGGARSDSTSNLIRNIKATLSYSNSQTTPQAINYSKLLGGAESESANLDIDKSSSTTTSSSTTYGTESDKTKSEKSDKTVTQSTTTESTNTGTDTNSMSLPSRSGRSLSRDSKSTQSSTKSSSKSSSSSSCSTSSCTSSKSSKSSSTSTSSSSSSYGPAIGKYERNVNYLSTSGMSDSNIISAKQFYSSDHGELYSSDTNYLRNNINKRRFR